MKTQTNIFVGAGAGTPNRQISRVAEAARELLDAISAMEHGQTTKAIRRLNDACENLSSALSQSKPCPCGACGTPIDENGDCGCDSKLQPAGPGVIEAASLLVTAIRESQKTIASDAVLKLETALLCNDTHAATRAALEDAAKLVDESSWDNCTDIATELRRRAALLQIPIPNAVAGCRSELDHVSGADNVATGSWNPT